MKMLSPLLISYRATAMRLLRKSEIILHITHCNTLNNFRHSLNVGCRTIDILSVGMTQWEIGMKYVILLNRN